MLTTDALRSLANEFVAAVQSQLPDKVLALCAEEVEWSGGLVRKISGEASGTVRGKAAMRPFLAGMLKEFGGRGTSPNRLWTGIQSVAIEATIAGIIPSLVVLVADGQGRVAQVHVHQEVH